MSLSMRGPGKARDIVAAVARFEGVRHAAACWGMPAIFVEVEIADEKRLSELAIDRIQKLDGVERTETNIVVK